MPVIGEVIYHGIGIFEYWLPPEFRSDYKSGDRVFFVQNTGRQIVPLGNLRKGLEDLLKGDCGAFVQRLLNKANERFGGGHQEGAVTSASVVMVMTSSITLVSSLGKERPF